MNRWLIYEREVQQYRENGLRGKLLEGTGIDEETRKIIQVLQDAIRLPEEILKEAEEAEE